jgi:hypothetical protein
MTQKCNWPVCDSKTYTTIVQGEIAEKIKDGKICLTIKCDRICGWPAARIEGKSGRKTIILDIQPISFKYKLSDDQYEQWKKNCPSISIGTITIEKNRYKCTIEWQLHQATLNILAYSRVY